MSNEPSNDAANTDGSEPGPYRQLGISTGGENPHPRTHRGIHLNPVEREELAQHLDATHSPALIILRAWLRGVGTP